MNDKQDGRQNGCLWSVCTCGGSHLVNYHQISPKFHARITLSTLAKPKYMFCPVKDNKMAVKMAASCRFALVNTLNKLFITRFLPNYIYRLLLSNSFPRSTVGIVRWIITKMAAQMATACLFACVDTLTWSFITHFLPNFIYNLTTFIKILSMGLSDER